MLIELGFYLFILAGFTSFLQFYTPFIKNFENKNPYLITIRRTAICTFWLLVTCELILVYAFLVSDFSVLSVVENSSVNQKLLYKISALWSFNRGSLLFITLLFSLISFLFAVRTNKVRIGKKDAFMLSCVGLINFLFILICILVSNPFSRVENPSLITDGFGLNPVLQHPIAAIHPPLIFISYALSLYIAVCSLCMFFIKGNHSKLKKEVKNFAFLNFVFCSLAILSGAYWAYQEAGWGGFWSWDPVECSALLNWLLIAGLNILLTNNKNKNLIALVGILIFCACIGGTVLIRSGLLVSVHAYVSNSPKKLLNLMALLAIYALPLYVAFKIFNFENFIKSLSYKKIFIFCLFIISAFIVAFGIYYPAFSNILETNRYYYKITLLFVLTFGVIFNFIEKIELKKIFKPKKQNLLLFLVIFLPLIFSYIIKNNILDKIILFLSLLLIFAVFYKIYIEVKSNKQTFFKNNKNIIKFAFYIGASLFIFSSVCSSLFSKHTQISLLPTESIKFNDYKFFFSNLEKYSTPNYRSIRGFFIITLDKKIVGVVAPEKRHYGNSNLSTLESDNVSHLFKNIKMNISSPDEEGKYVIDIMTTPFYRTYWLSAFFALFCIMFLFYLTNKEES